MFWCVNHGTTGAVDRFLKKKKKKMMMMTKTQLCRICIHEADRVISYSVIFSW